MPSRVVKRLNTSTEILRYLSTSGEAETNKCMCKIIPLVYKYLYITVCNASEVLFMYLFCNVRALFVLLKETANA